MAVANSPVTSVECALTKLSENVATRQKYWFFERPFKEKGYLSVKDINGQLKVSYVALNCLQRLGRFLHLCHTDTHLSALSKPDVIAALSYITRDLDIKYKRHEVGTAVEYVASSLQNKILAPKLKEERAFQAVLDDIAGMDEVSLEDELSKTKETAISLGNDD